MDDRMSIESSDGSKSFDSTIRFTRFVAKKPWDDDLDSIASITSSRSQRGDFGFEIEQSPCYRDISSPHSLDQSCLSANKSVESDVAFEGYQGFGGSNVEQSPYDQDIIPPSLLDQSCLSLNHGVDCDVVIEGNQGFDGSTVEQSPYDRDIIPPCSLDQSCLSSNGSVNSDAVTGINQLDTAVFESSLLLDDAASQSSGGSLTQANPPSPFQVPTILAEQPSVPLETPMFIKAFRFIPKNPTNRQDPPNHPAYQTRDAQGGISDSTLRLPNSHSPSKNAVAYSRSAVSIGDSGKHRNEAPHNTIKVIADPIRDGSYCASLEHHNPDCKSLNHQSMHFDSLKLKSSCHNSFVCFCKRTLFVDCQDSIEVVPCGCLICPECAFIHVMNRKFTDFACPCCEKEASSITYKRGMEGTTKKISPLKHQADKIKDPCRFFMDAWSKSSDEMNNKAILSVTTVDSETKAPRAVSTLLDLEEGPETPFDEFILVNIFTLLHRPLFSSISRRNNVPAPQATMGEVIEFAAFYDDSLLFRLVYALGTGETRVSGVEDWRKLSPQDERRWANGNLSRLCGIFIAKEMLLRVTSNGPGIFQYAMSHMLDHTNANKATRELFSRIRLAAHPTCLSRAHRRTLDSVLRNSSRVHNSLDHCCASLDNIGFRRKFDYLNWTLVQSFLNKCPKLKALGFYQRTQPLSREPVGFEAFHARQGSDLATAKAIVGCQDKDYDTLSTYVLTHIRYCRSCPLPSYDVCRNMIEANNFTNGFTFRANLGLRLDPQTSLSYLRDKVRT